MSSPMLQNNWFPFFQSRLTPPSASTSLLRKYPLTGVSKSVRRPFQAEAETEMFMGSFEKLFEQTPGTRIRLVGCPELFCILVLWWGSFVEKVDVRRDLLEPFFSLFCKKLHGSDPFGVWSGKNLDWVPNNGISIVCLEAPGGLYAYLQPS